MNRHRSTHLLQALGAFVLLLGLSLNAQAATDPGWPRHYSNGGAELVVYQPQVDSWREFKILKGRCAFALKPAPAADPVYGTFRFDGQTLVDADRKVVLLRNVRASDMRFPSVPGGASAQYAELTKRLLPTDAIVVSLDRLLAFVRAGEVPHREAQVVTNPPPIFVSKRPAVLVIVDGDPVMLEVENTTLRRVLNTNWDLFQDQRTNLYYLRNDGSWLVATDLKGPYAPATDIPADLASLPMESSEESKAASKNSLSQTAPPLVIVVHRPSELIVLRGSPEMTPIDGTHLVWVTNTESDLFYDVGGPAYYFLTSGRWFRAATLEGPWEYASSTLPEDFQKIPPDDPRAHVLAAVPGAREAEDAVLLSAIPRTAEIKRNEAKAEVQYVGTPEFVPISGTSVSYAKNTPSDVLRVGDLYYLCFQGVWFASTSPNGPWHATDSIPQEIYTIPESSPKYNVTYVRIYDSTPTTVVVGYTPGYYGAFVYGGVVVWGTGYYYPPYVAVGVAVVPVYWAAPCYTYGASAWYNPANGVYARGASVYGPYGGFGAAAAYNPRTGTYAQGAAVWGPNGGAAAARTYNPSTGTYSAGYRAANPYGSWGEGVVTNGSDWARGGYRSTSRGTVAAGETSQGGAGVAFGGAGGKSGYVAKSGSGDVYAGTNGNVYKRDDGQWYRNQDGSWNAIDKGEAQAQRDQAAARDRGTRNAQMSERARTNSGGLARGRGSEQRPRLQGRGR